MTNRIILPSDLICTLVRRQDVSTILRDGLRSVDSGGPDILGAPEYRAKRASVELPPPFRGPASAYVPMRFTPLTPATLSVITGYRGAQQIAPKDLVFLNSKPEWLSRLRRAFLFTDMGLASGAAKLFADLSRLDVIDRDLIASGRFDTRQDPRAPHIVEAEFLVWEALPPRGILEIVCSHEGGISSIEADIAAAGRSGGITVRADAKWFFGRG